MKNKGQYVKKMDQLIENMKGILDIVEKESKISPNKPIQNLPVHSN